MYKVLLVEDDKDIRELICDYFHSKSDGAITIDTAVDGQEGVEKAYENSYDLLLLDIMLPELNGFQVCKEVRADNDVPIIFITARAQESDMLRAYGLGCDDYVVKPFPLPVLYEKVNALIKRSKGLVRLPQFYTNNLTLNPNNGKVVSFGEELTLTSKEFSILKLLFENKGKIVTRDSIIRKLWGYDCDIDERIIDTHIKNLRKALKDNAKLIKTVRSRGYILEE
ncbi:MAG: response regulator transcription factor [Eubacteriales bacterium]|nr:response regulator transcription factor [Eubacteriales bacterium]